MTQAARSVKSTTPLSARVAVPASEYDPTDEQRGRGDEQPDHDQLFEEDHSDERDDGRGGV